jgi:hypothetical protein
MSDFVNIVGGSIGFLNLGTISGVRAIRGETNGRGSTLDIVSEEDDKCPHCQGESNEDDAVCAVCNPRNTTRRK